MLLLCYLLIVICYLLNHCSRIQYRVLRDDDDPVNNMIMAVVAVGPAYIVNADTAAFAYADILVDDCPFDN